MESKRCKCSSYWLHRRHLGLQDFSGNCSLLTHIKLKCKAVDFKTLCFLKILQSYPYPLSESSPGYAGKGHTNPQVEMSEVYFYIVVMNSPSMRVFVPPPKWSPPWKWSPPPKWSPITTEMIPIRNRNDPVINFRNLGLNGLGTMLSILNSSFIHANTILKRGK